MANLRRILDSAVEQFSPETKRLHFLPESRYNKNIFPTTGQYDWFSGQVLYFLVRYLRPVRIIEVSTSSGYSSLFSALALKANEFGRLETFELLPEIASAAWANFERFGVQDYVRLHVGDAREKAHAVVAERNQKREKEILFLDSEHTEEFARFFLDTFLPDTHPESLFHMHDVLPPNANVMYRPLEVLSDASFRTRGRIYYLLKRMVPSLAPPDLRSWVKPETFNPKEWTSEGSFAHKLATDIPSEEQIYIHNLIGKYPVLNGRSYDTHSIWRCDSRGRPMEWNESWWCICGALESAYRVCS